MSIATEMDVVRLKSAFERLEKRVEALEAELAARATAPDRQTLGMRMKQAVNKAAGSI